MDPLASPKPPDDAEAQVRTLLGEWAERTADHSVPEFGKKISIVSIRDRTAYAGFLRCLLDVRSQPVDKTLAYRESAPPKAADKSNLWSIPSGLSKQFLEQEAAVVAAESTEPTVCNLCAGEGQTGACETCRGAKTGPCESCSHRGRKSCQACQGRGSIQCAQCSGSGKVLLSLTADGMRTEDACPQCMGKKNLPCHDCADASVPDCAVCANKRVVACAACEGRGTSRCQQCEGSRRVVAGFTMQIAYRVAYYRSLVRDPSIPEAVFPEDPASGKLGKTVLEVEGDGDASLAAKKPEGPAGAAFEKVLAQSSSPGLGANAKLILQTLSVEKIPIYEVAYSFEGKEYHAWATLFENRVVSLDDPFADLAARLAGEAEAFLNNSDFTHFEERAAQASTLAPKNPAAADLRKKAGAVQRRAVIAFGAKVAAGLAVAVPSVLALLYKSPNRFIPLGALALGAAGAALAAVFRLGDSLASRPLLPPKRRDALASAAASGGVAVALAVFLIAAPVRRIDAREFAGVVARYAAVPYSDWHADDAAGVTGAIKDYGKRGVDTTAGQDLLDGYSNFLAVARAQALLAEQARQKAARAARLKAEQERKEAAAEKALQARLAAKKKAADKAKKKKKKKTVTLSQ